MRKAHVRTKSTSLLALLILASAAAHAADGARVVNNELHFSFTPPAGFAPYAEGITSPDDLYSFAKGDPGSEHGAIVLQVQRMRGTIGRDATDLAIIPKELQATAKVVHWHGFPLQQLRTVQQGMIMHLVQVPTKGEAIQLIVGGAPQWEAELEPALQSTLLSLDAESNWLTDSERMQTIAMGIAKTTVLVAVAIGVIVTIRRRRQNAKKLP